ncbi:MAG: SH3 domain-containing protein [Pseudomonadota bacterium]
MSHILCALLLLSCLPSQALSLDLFDNDSPDVTDSVFLEVTEPYIEMHTGPGRGYPVFNVVEQGETIEILKRKTNWYKVKSADDRAGWTKASQLAHTLKPTGIPVDLPEVNHGDYLKSSWRVGFSAGQVEGANTFSISAGYRPLSWAGVELEWGKIFDDSVTSDFYGANLLVEPMPDWTVTPFVTTGAGKFSFNNRHKVLVEDTGTSSYISFGAGANYYIGRNFVMRGEYRWYSVSTDDDSVGLNSWRIGLNTFF